jgi:hypothetical protein
MVSAAAAILFCSFLVRFGCALRYPNMLWPDEIFQTLEPAHRLAFGYGIIPWEFRVGTRSWVLPGLLAGIMRATSWIGVGSVGYLFGVKAFLCLLSLTTVLFAFSWTYRLRGLAAAVVSSLISAFWYELIYYSPKALFEVVATHLLLPGLYFSVPGKLFKPWNRLFIAGLFLGCAAALRINLAPAILVIAVFACRKEWSARWIPMAVGISLPLLIAGLLDFITWSYPFQSTVLNLWINIAQKKAAHFGVSPWYFYVKWLIKRLGPLVLLAIIGARRSPLLSWLVVVIILSHSVIGHKEYRFIYPVIPLIIVLAGLGMDDLVRLARNFYSSPAWAKATCTILLAGALSTSVILGQRYRGDYQYPIGSGAGNSNWTQFSGNLQAVQELSQAGDVCGLGLWRLNWAEWGGYAYLHQRVPLLEQLQLNEGVRRGSEFNYLLTATALPVELSDYHLEKCWQDVCLYKRPGPCVAVPGYDINEVIKMP